LAGKTVEKTVALEELVHGGVGAVILAPKDSRLGTRRVAIEGNDAHEIAIGQMHDALPDDQRGRGRSAAEVGPEHVEFPQLPAIRHAQGLELAIGGDEQATLPADHGYRGSLAFSAQRFRQMRFTKNPEQLAGRRVERLADRVKFPVWII